MVFEENGLTTLSPLSAPFVGILLRLWVGETIEVKFGVGHRNRDFDNKRCHVVSQMNWSKSVKTCIGLHLVNIATSQNV